MTTISNDEGGSLIDALRHSVCSLYISGRRYQRFSKIRHTAVALSNDKAPPTWGSDLLFARDS